MNKTKFKKIFLNIKKKIFIKQNNNFNHKIKVPNSLWKIELGTKKPLLSFAHSLVTDIRTKNYKAFLALCLAALGLVLPLAMGMASYSPVYVNGYPTLNGNYVDCNGNIDSDMAHHTTSASDSDPNHHVGQSCPAGTLVGDAQNTSPQTGQSLPAVQVLSSPSVDTTPVQLISTATNSLAYACPAPAANAFTGCYYTDQNFGNLGLPRTDAYPLNFSWGSGSPDPSLPADHFSVRWQGNFSFNSGSYVFTITGDDGIRLKIDGNTVIDQMHDQAATTYTSTQTMASGNHLITIEYYESAGGAVAKASWGPSSSAVAAPTSASASGSGVSCPSPAANSFAGCYYNDMTLSNPVLSRNDPAINFDWGGGSPDPSLPVDKFSARWQGNFNFNAGNYTFTATADDGVRLYVDGNLIIDKFVNQPATTYTAAQNMSAGSHLIKVEYYENGGGAVAKASWSPSVSATPVSTTVTPPASTSDNPLSGVQLYRDLNSNAQQWISANGSSQPANAQLMAKIASQPNAVWLGGWNTNVQSDVANIINTAKNQGQVPVFVVYNIPNRDCGGYSAGGAQTPQAYQSWITAAAAGIGGSKAIIVLEPDATALISCLSSSELQTRYSLLSNAVSAFKSLGNTSVYIDAGHPNWIDPVTMAGRLQQAGLGKADGFALDISNFNLTSDNISYGQGVSSQAGGKHFIIDTSRNGLGPTPDNQWCNPPGRGLGSKPTTNTGNSLVDALIWGKDPGGSDGNCNGGPNAGVFWPSYALMLAQNSIW